MKSLVAMLTLATSALLAQTPDNLVVEGVPAHPPELKRDVNRYLEFRTAAFLSWHPQKREMLISTRFSDTAQLHLVKFPGGARQQLTFFAEPVGGGSFHPKTGEYAVFTQDTGGGEFYQLYRFDLANAKVTLLTDGKSRNTSARWADSGKWLAYASTRRNGKDNDIYIVDPADPVSNRLVAQVKGGGWEVADWSPDESTLIVGNYVSINQSHLHLLDVRSGRMSPLTPPDEKGVAWSGAKFSPDGKTVYTATDKDSEFRRLTRIDLTSKELTVLTPNLKWDVESFDLSPDGKTLAYVANEDGSSALHLLDTSSLQEKPAPKLPLGVMAGVRWHSNGRDLGFSLAHANSPADAYSLDVTDGKLTRWTESETGGLDSSKFRQPKIIRTQSFDGLTISAFVYQPDPAKFAGKRPVIINIHGGPESQARPIFQGRNNYYLDELGVAVIFPNVRGSDGYGKTFLTLDNGFKREDSVKDVGAIIDWVKTQPDLDASRIAVTGGSYGGYMTLASLTHYSDRVKCGVDIVGISNFVTFLENTQDYRRDLRRVEYGDERDPAMREHLMKISPTTNVKKINVPLFVVQGKNDPRVPLTEAEQMVKAVRENGGPCWYLMAKDEGHGFQKKKNADFQFLSTILFFNQHLLAPEPVK
ncbi:MAG TPA: S9 family peptidase [Candidatus Limnocylindria bacterium]|nr:S9 family peptidase [Candidatus Limnocylindria bacterium]